MLLARKIELFESGLPSIIRKCNLTEYKIYKNIPLSKNDFSVNTARQIREQIPLEDLKDCQRLIYSNYGKTKRIRKRIETIFFQLKFHKDLAVYFLTLTFNDKTLQKTNEDTRHQKIFRTLKNLPGVIDYVANIDYGSENEREHYHGIILVNQEFNFRKTKQKNLYKMSLPCWDKNGFSDLREVKILNEKALSKYINKFTNHAKKDTTKEKRVIYCKDPKYPKATAEQLVYYNTRLQNRKRFTIPDKVRLIWATKNFTRVYEKLPFNEE